MPLIHTTKCSQLFSMNLRTHEKRRVCFRRGRSYQHDIIKSGCSGGKFLSTRWRFIYISPILRESLFQKYHFQNTQSQNTETLKTIHIIILVYLIYTLLATHTTLKMWLHLSFLKIHKKKYQETQKLAS